MIYFVVWALLLLPYLGKKKLDRYGNFDNSYSVYVLLLLTLLIGMRDVSVGADTSHYEYLYDVAYIRIGPDAYDRGYYLLTYWLGNIGVSYREFLIGVAFFSSATLVRYYDTHSRNLAFSVFVFMTIGLLPMYMTGIRQVIAISICLIALMYMEKKQYILSAILIFVASRFHASAIVFYVMLLLSNIQLTRKQTWIMIVIASCALFYSNLLINVAGYVLPEKYAKIDMTEGYDINLLLIIIAILIPVFCAFFDKTDRNGRFSKQQSCLYVMSSLNIILNILALNSMYFSRLAYYFVHANSILIPNVVFAQKRRNNRIIMLFTIISVCALYFIISIPEGTLKIDKYKVFWQG